jgi:queuosine precursor transporter
VTKGMGLRTTQGAALTPVGLACAIGFLATVFGSNWAIQRYGLVPVGFGLSAPAGVYFAGLAFTLRDLTQRVLGRGGVVMAIAVGAGLSVMVAPRYALASGAAFLLSELCDFAIYTPLEQRGWMSAVAASNAVGLLVDSVVFLGLAFGSLSFLTGQVVGKTWMTLLAIVVLLPLRNRTRSRLAN